MHINANLLKECLEESFDVYDTPSTYQKMTLVELKDRSDEQMECFSAFFTGHEAFEIVQGTYTFVHPSIDSKQLFMTPIGKEDGLVTYQVVINQLRNK